MIEIARSIPNPAKIAAWLETTIRPTLRPDVSRYARGRLRAWLGVEPQLVAPHADRPGVLVPEKILTRLRELMEWDFDYCLVTYSGDEVAVGISPHRDAGCLSYEGYGLHLTGECRFDYWSSRQSFTGPGRVVEVGEEPTHSLLLQPGEVVRFNTKNLHAASPGVGRWNINFWRKKSSSRG
jgi:hypothetical protein